MFLKPSTLGSSFWIHWVLELKARIILLRIRVGMEFFHLREIWKNWGELEELVQFLQIFSKGRTPFPLVVIAPSERFTVVSGLLTCYLMHLYHWASAIGSKMSILCFPCSCNVTPGHLVVFGLWTLTMYIFHWASVIGSEMSILCFTCSCNSWHHSNCDILLCNN